MDANKKIQTIEQISLVRKILLQSLALIFLFFMVFFLLSDQVYQFIAQPLLAKLPIESKMIATNITTPLLVPIKLSFYSALFVTTPFILFLCWRFIAPGLYQNEKRLLWLSLLVTAFLFYLGVLFCYFLILPLVFNFLISMVPSYITLLPDMSHYLSFSLKLMFAFGLVFETPLAIVLLTTSTIVGIEKLRAWRPYFIVGAFVIGMLLTPPDVISQICLAIPLWILYEIGLISSHWVLRKIIKE